MKEIFGRPDVRVLGSYTSLTENQRDGIPFIAVRYQLLMKRDDQLTTDSVEVFIKAQISRTSYADSYKACASFTLASTC